MSFSYSSSSAMFLCNSHAHTKMDENKVCRVEAWSSVVMDLPRGQKLGALVLVSDTDLL